MSNKTVSLVLGSGAALARATMHTKAFLVDRREVFLNEDGNLRWRGFKDGQEVIYKKEPEATWGQRFTAGFMRILPIRGQL